jgi:hypothetical protein
MECQLPKEMGKKGDTYISRELTLIIPEICRTRFLQLLVHTNKVRRNLTSQLTFFVFRPLRLQRTSLSKVDTMSHGDLHGHLLQYVDTAEEPNEVAGGQYNRQEVEDKRADSTFKFMVHSPEGNILQNQTNDQPLQSEGHAINLRLDSEYDPVWITSDWITPMTFPNNLNYWEVEGNSPKLSAGE